MRKVFLLFTLSAFLFSHLARGSEEQCDIEANQRFVVPSSLAHQLFYNPTNAKAIKGFILENKHRPAILTLESQKGTRSFAYYADCKTHSADILTT